MNTLRNVVLVANDGEDTLPKEFNLENPARMAAIAMGMVSVATAMASGVMLMYPEEIQGATRVMIRKMQRLERKFRQTPYFAESKAFVKRIQNIFSRSRDPRLEVPTEVTSAANIEDAEIRLAFGGYDREVSKTRIKVALRVLQVAVGLLTVAVSLFRTLSSWEDDPGMVALYEDTKGIVTSAGAAGYRGTAQRIMNMAVYRTVRNTTQIGGLLPRSGKDIIPRTASTNLDRRISGPRELMRAVQFENFEEDEEGDHSLHLDAGLWVDIAQGGLKVQVHNSVTDETRELAFPFTAGDLVEAIDEVWYHEPGESYIA